jgi:putative methylase
MASKSALAIMLSKLKQFSNPKPELEQYSTDSETAAEILWNACMLGDIAGKTIADLGAGTGILGIGCIALNAKKVYFVEIDDDAAAVLKINIEGWKNCAIIQSDAAEFDRQVDTIVMNPPFGVQKRKADKVFVETAFKAAKAVYYIGKIESKGFIEAMCRENKKIITHFFEFILPLKKTMKHHTKDSKKIKIGCWRIVSLR